MPTRLDLRVPNRLPIDVRAVDSSSLLGKSRRDIERIPVRMGRTCVPLAELFQVRKKGDDKRIEWSGDLHAVHYLGYRQDTGETYVEGSAGDHLGGELQGGRITVTANAGHYVASGMRQGEIVIYGNAGQFAGGAASTGAPPIDDPSIVGESGRNSHRATSLNAYGMNGGVLLVHGSVGDHAAYRMRRGLLAITGNAGNGLARSMRAGTVYLGGTCGTMMASGLGRGTLMLAGIEQQSIPPWFGYACRSLPVVTRLIERALHQRNLAITALPPAFDIYHGDCLEGGRGELLCWTNG